MPLPSSLPLPLTFSDPDISRFRSRSPGASDPETGLSRSRSPVTLASHPDVQTRMIAMERRLADDIEPRLTNVELDLAVDAFISGVEVAKPAMEAAPTLPLPKRQPVGIMDVPFDSTSSSVRSKRGMHKVFISAAHSLSTDDAREYAQRGEVPFWIESLKTDIQAMFRKEMSDLRDQVLNHTQKGHMVAPEKDDTRSSRLKNPVVSHVSGHMSPHMSAHMTALMNAGVPSVYGVERSHHLRVGDRVVVVKEARTKGRTGTVIDPDWKPGLVQVVMDEADEKGKMKSYKPEDLRLIKEKGASLRAGNRVVIFQAGRAQGKTGTVVNPNWRVGMVQVAMDEADECGKTDTYKLEELRLIQERGQTLRMGDRVAVSKEARTNAWTGTVMEPDWESGLIQVVMDEAGEKRKIESYKPGDLILIQDLKLIQERVQSLVVGDRVVVSKHGQDNGKLGTVIDPDWQLGLIQVAMDEADEKGKLKSYNPDDLKLIEDAEIISRFSAGNHLKDRTASNLDRAVSSSTRRGGRAHGFSVIEKVIREGKFSRIDRFAHLKTYFPEPEKTCSTCVVQSRIFFFIITVAVLGNAVWAGISANEQMKDNKFVRQSISRWIDLGFNWIFIVEMLLKIGSLRANYFFGRDRAWNCFDFVLAAISILEMVQTDRKPGSMASFMRVLRMFRIFKLFLVMRVVKDLRLMCFVLYQSFTVLVWVFVVYFFFTYCFSVIIMQSASTYMEGTSSGRDGRFARVKAKYGYVWDSMLVVLNILTGGDWAEAVTPLAELSFGYKIMFAAYMFFMTFGMLNVVIGVVCEKALFAIGSDKVLRTVRHRENTSTFLRSMCMMFKEMDVNKSGYVNMTDFLAYIDNEVTGDYLRSYGIATHSPHELFSFLDMQDGQCTGEIDCPSFLLAMERLAGGVRGSDLVLLRRDVRELKKMITNRFSQTSPEPRETLISSCRSSLDWGTGSSVWTEKKSSSVWTESATQSTHYGERFSIEAAATTR